MSSREERMAENEAASRQVNERIEGAYEDDPPERSIHIVCECALKSCDRRVAITIAEYHQVRSDPRQFAVVPEHFIGDIEGIVYETDRFAVVAKREGIPAQVAIEETPPG